MKEQIASNLLDLAQEIAEKHHANKIAIESLSDQMLPDIDNAGVAAIVRETIENWAYTWLDVLQGGIDPHEADRGDAMRHLMSLPLERYFTHS